MTVSLVDGIIGVCVTLVCFGSGMVPMKYGKKPLDPFLFQTIASVGVLLSSTLVLAWSHFEFTWYAFAGAAMWVPANILAIYCVRLIGVSVGQGTWSGLVCVVSFLWGALGNPIWDSGHHCTMKSLPIAIVGLVLLVSGVAGIAFCSGMSASSSSSSSKDDSASINSKAVEESPLLEGRKTNAPPASSTPAPGSARALGLACAACIGCLAGSMLVPTKLAPKDSQGVSYALPFAFGAFAISAFLLLCRLVYLQRMPECELQNVWPAFCMGCLWNIGNVASIYVVNSSLGFTVGYPLTQGSLLVAGLWGILFFKEIKGTKVILIFAVSAVVLLGGGSMLSIFGRCSSA